MTPLDLNTLNSTTLSRLSPNISQSVCAMGVGKVYPLCVLWVVSKIFLAFLSDHCHVIYLMPCRHPQSHKIPFPAHSKGHVEVTQALLEAGADKQLSVYNRQGVNAFFMAVIQDTVLAMKQVD